MSIAVLLLLIAVILWAIAAFGVSTSRFNLIAGGLFFAGLSFLLPMFGVG